MKFLQISTDEVYGDIPGSKLASEKTIITLALRTQRLKLVLIN